MALKHNPDILSIWMLFLVFVVRNVALLLGENGVVASHAAVFARVPVRAALPKDDVAGNDQLRRGFLRTEAPAGALGGFVGPTFCDVGSGAGEEERGEKEPNGRRKAERGNQRGDVTRRHNCIYCSPIGRFNVNM